MTQQEGSLGDERTRLMEELDRRYSGGHTKRWLYLRKRYAWMMIVGGVAWFKRILDIAIAASMLILLSPLLLVVAAAVKLWDGGPIFYVAPRVGKWGREFMLPKFRTMMPDAAERKSELQDDQQTESGKRFKMKRDPRVTALGRIMRKTSIDELPQLWCVIRGDMSLVGPRPPLPKEVAEYTLEERRRLDVRPGITCVWQVSGRSDLSFDQQVDLDVQYIESRSLLLDLKLLMKTIPAVLSGRGAY